MENNGSQRWSGSQKSCQKPDRPLYIWMAPLNDHLQKKLSETRPSSLDLAGSIGWSWLFVKRIVRNLGALFTFGRLIQMIQIVCKKDVRNSTVLFAFGQLIWLIMIVCKKKLSETEPPSLHLAGSSGWSRSFTKENCQKLDQSLCISSVGWSRK